MSREFTNGQSDLRGSLTNTLRVGDIVGRQPFIRWSTTCERCGVSSTAAHSKLINGTAFCQNGGCGRGHILEALEDTPDKARKRQAASEAARRREDEAAEAAQLAELESTYAQTATKIARTIRERLLTQRDDEIFISADTVGKSMSQADASIFNKKEVALYCQRHPFSAEWLPIIGSYFERNGLAIISQATLAAAIKRLSTYGLLPQPEAHTPPSAPTSAPVASQRFIRDVDEIAEISPKKEPEEWIGIDPNTGRERAYTSREVDRLSAYDFRRAFKLVASDLLLPTRGW
jgi:hypothetical protein